MQLRSNASLCKLQIRYDWTLIPHIITVYHDCNSCSSSHYQKQQVNLFSDVTHSFWTNSSTLTPQYLTVLFFLFWFLSGTFKFLLHYCNCFSSGSVCEDLLPQQSAVHGAESRVYALDASTSSIQCAKCFHCQNKFKLLQSYEIVWRETQTWAYKIINTHNSANVFNFNC